MIRVTSKYKIKIKIAFCLWLSQGGFVILFLLKSRVALYSLPKYRKCQKNTDFPWHLFSWTGLWLLKFSYRFIDKHQCKCIKAFTVFLWLFVVVVVASKEIFLIAYQLFLKPHFRDRKMIFHFIDMNCAFCYYKEEVEEDTQCRLSH